nr:MAG TPA: hypothetical protein [Caudoviricetes sp.]DAQ43805.1 MAG TPA: hypothetical protein [Caudoviricetes sp.]
MFLRCFYSNILIKKITQMFDSEDNVRFILSVKTR